MYVSREIWIKVDKETREEVEGLVPGGRDGCAEDYLANINSELQRRGEFDLIGRLLEGAREAKERVLMDAEDAADHEYITRSGPDFEQNYQDGYDDSFLGPLSEINEDWKRKSAGYARGVKKGEKDRLRNQAGLI